MMVITLVSYLGVMGVGMKGVLGVDERRGATRGAGSGATAAAGRALPHHWKPASGCTSFRLPGKPEEGLPLCRLISALDRKATPKSVAPRTCARGRAARGLGRFRMIVRRRATARWAGTAPPKPISSAKTKPLHASAAHHVVRLVADDLDPRPPVGDAPLRQEDLGVGEDHEGRRARLVAACTVFCGGERGGRGGWVRENGRAKAGWGLSACKQRCASGGRGCAKRHRANGAPRVQLEAAGGVVQAAAVRVLVPKLAAHVHATWRVERVERVGRHDQRTVAHTAAANGSR